LSDRLIEIARRREAQAWNLPGTDKTWVLHALWEHRLFQKEVARARRAGGH
jgi:hypothetical protein